MNLPLRQLIVFAYQIQGYQLVGGPSWINDTRYDITAKFEGDPPPVRPGTGADHMMLATRTLLAERFQLKIHRETRQLDIYALMMDRPDGKPGPALKPASDACSPTRSRRGAEARRRRPAPVRSAACRSFRDGCASAGIHSRSSPA